MDTLNYIVCSLGIIVIGWVIFALIHDNIQYYKSREEEEQLRKEREKKPPFFIEEETNIVKNETRYIVKKRGSITDYNETLFVTSKLDEAKALLTRLLSAKNTIIRKELEL